MSESVDNPEQPDPGALIPDAAPDPNLHLQVDTSDDNDSTLGFDTLSTASASLTSSIQNYKYENGRRYHAFREGTYPLPNDEPEQDRQDLLHHIFRLILGGKLFRAPLGHAPPRVLDVGTGTGIWAMDFADEFPQSVVIGTDLSPIQPKWVPPNCKFVIDDAESDWLYRPEEAFDYIHWRGLGGSVADWPRYYRQVWNHLVPGGWCEAQEYEAWLRSDDDSIQQTGKSILQWIALVDEASTKFGKKINIAKLQKQYMIDAGFVDVRDEMYKVPVGTWPKDPKLKQIGMFEREHMIAAVEPFTLALLTRVLGWSVESTQVLMANVRNEFLDKRNHLYSYFHFVYGRKPEAPT
ncbi:uncharacterized protein PV07_00245 [Cladophialophora immunda]|uniref:Methyltransferase domain-containing protein n=1 Tax=Cladophialophora immunda TaxID=569365 RepID=A0A0D1ZZ28_9EURO|nr:uncharacterized protein PV07_00245 [Cladophialophora immunda]KIW33391.1 hypothetical protein PV07_00245 [Cladophialophora immunda]